VSGTRTGRHGGSTSESTGYPASAQYSPELPYQSPHDTDEYSSTAGYPYDPGYPNGPEFSDASAYPQPQYQRQHGQAQYAEEQYYPENAEYDRQPGYDQNSGYEQNSGYDQHFPQQAEPETEPAPIPAQRSRSNQPPETDPRARRGDRPRTKTSVGGKAVRGLVVLALVGSVTAFVAFDKTIELSVDGQVQQVHSFAGTVGAVLAANSISTGSHDLVTPAPSATATDDSTITVRYGRPVDVTVNGVKAHDWVHSTTVGGALTELGVRITGADLSVPAGTPISRQGMDFTVYTQRQVTILVDGKTLHVTTTAPTVAALLTQADITLQNQDTASAAATSVPTEGETLTILRITGTTEVKQVSIPFQITKQNDASIYSGVTSVVTAGQDGVAQVTYALQIIDGVAQPAKQISQTVTKQPVTEVVDVGTKPLPADAADLDWAALAQCESGGNPRSVDSSGTYYGLYQFSVGTWDSLGGTGLPNAASPAEQTDLAELLYERSGVGQWPVCGPNLYK
jgi:uncharacterized protein YabE (DUF348 family)